MSLSFCCHFVLFVKNKKKKWRLVLQFVQNLNPLWLSCSFFLACINFTDPNQCKISMLDRAILLMLLFFGSIPISIFYRVYYYVMYERNSTNTENGDVLITRDHFVKMVSNQVIMVRKNCFWLFYLKKYENKTCNTKFFTISLEKMGGSKIYFHYRSRPAILCRLYKKNKNLDSQSNLYIIQVSFHYRKLIWRIRCLVV